MKAYLEGQMWKIIRKVTPGKKDPNVRWESITYQIMCDFGDDLLADVENITVFEREGEAKVDSLLEAALGKKAMVRVLVDVKADRREGRQGELQTRIIRVEPYFERKTTAVGQAAEKLAGLGGDK